MFNLKHQLMKSKIKLQQGSSIIEGDSKYLAPELLTGMITKKADIFRH